jgi:hypothetical protein
MLPYILAAVGGYLIGDSLKGKQFADGGMMADGGIPKEKSLLHFVQNEASSGSIANKTKYSSYKDIDAIRIKAVEILMRDGDREYSLQAFNDLIQEAVILIEEDELTGESEGERRIGMDYMAGGMEGGGDTSRMMRKVET